MPACSCWKRPSLLDMPERLVTEPPSLRVEGGREGGRGEGGERKRERERDILIYIYNIGTT